MKKVKVAAKVTEVAFELPDGRVWVFAFDMDAVALMEEAGEGSLGKLHELLNDFMARPVSALTSILYFGLKARQPEITLEEVRRALPPTPEIMEAVMAAVADAMPGGGEDLEGQDPTGSIQKVLQMMGLAGSTSPTGTSERPTT